MYAASAVLGEPNEPTKPQNAHNDRHFAGDFRPVSVASQESDRMDH